MLSGNEIREAFLHFFSQRGHTILPSSSLVPDDATTLFTTAGMQQFVPWFRREVTPPYGSVATVQKCARTDDLDQVGRTARHHTFFEMLGNFSFGDYFKAETLRWGWEFSTLPTEQGGLGLDADAIWVTYYKPAAGEPYQEDLEARQIWLEIGVPESRILPLGKKENWWGPVGDSGPCGPCSEMHYDRGVELACSAECTSPACGCDRWIEFWNHVFQQFNYSDGAYHPLPTPGIDTGAGLERIASLVQRVDSNYESDLLQPIIHATLQLAARETAAGHEQMALRVIADHLRCAAFMIADGVLPSNAKRGYVVRRIIRRAYRFGRTLGFTQPFLYQLAPTLVDIMQGYHAALTDNAAFIVDTLKAEEARFAVTLERGEELLARMIEETRAAGNTALAGEEVFTLYDTYGFPRELTEETAREAGLTIDDAGYAQALARARALAKAEGTFSYEATLALSPDLPATTFVGYQAEDTPATLLHAAWSEEQSSAVLVLDRTPFYATSGGQLSDTGCIICDGATLPVVEATRDKFGHVLHRVDMSGQASISLTAPRAVTARVDHARRSAIRRAHTATHLLHWALQQVLGDHAKQTGSLVDADLLRFDFSHPVALSEDEVRRVEELVYSRVLDDATVTILEMHQQQARDAGYTALFGEKYGDWVRTVNIGETEGAFSRELCGGTHADRTGQIGFFSIISEGSVSAGNRRIEACTGLNAAARARQRAALLAEVASELKTTPDELCERVRNMQRELRDLQQQITALKVKIAAGAGSADAPSREEIGGFAAVIQQVTDSDAETLGSLCDQYLQRIAPGIVVLASATDGKVLFAVKVSKELTGTVHAGTLVREAAKIAGGGGGGRADFAQAGGKDAAQISAALQKAREMIAALGSG